MSKFKVNEIFYSLQGEGRWTGFPCIFIRLSGCNLHCEFCDTPDQCNMELTADEIINKLSEFPKEAKRIVLTGGEPLLQDAHLLRDALVEEMYLVHLETNGTFDISGHWDWVCISPKNKDIPYYNLAKADEVRFLHGTPEWDLLIQFYERLLQPKTLRYISAVADPLLGLDQKWIELAVEWVKEHPRYSLSLQIHKLIGIR